MKNNQKTPQVTESFWLAGFFVAFGIQLAYIALILVTEELAGTLFAFLPLVLMPLFECALGFFYGFLTYRRTDRRTPALATALGSLALAGLLYEISVWALRGWHWDLSVLLFDAILVGSLGLGLCFGFRWESLKRKILQRRNRFHD